jgi:hypothetical protein
MTARFEIGCHASKYVEGFYAFFAHITIGRRTWYVQRARASAYDRRERKPGSPRLILWIGPVSGYDVGTWRTA